MLYLPLTALVTLAVLLAALGDQTTLHFILPNEVVAPISPSAVSSADHVVALHSHTGSENHQLTPTHSTFQTIQLCKRLDQIPAMFGFAYLLVMLLITIFILITSKFTKNVPSTFQEVSSHIKVVNCNNFG